MIRYLTNVVTGTDSASLAQRTQMRLPQVSGSQISLVTDTTACSKVLNVNKANVVNRDDAAGITRGPELQYHNGHDHRENRVRICGQPMRGFLFFSHSASLGVSTTSVEVNTSAGQALSGGRKERSEAR
jgi:hypothetical protein